MTDVLAALLAVREVFVYLPKRLEEVKQEIKQCELEIEDLQHVMEFASLNASQGFAMYRQMKEVRNKRRILKNELEILDVIKRLNSAGKPSDKHINQAIGEARKIIRTQENRTYSMRVRHDLQELVK